MNAAERPTRKCLLCPAKFAGPGSYCGPCGVVLRRIGEIDRGRNAHEAPVAGLAERVGRYAERAARGEPLFTEADRALRGDPCE